MGLRLAEFDALRSVAHAVATLCAAGIVGCGATDQQQPTVASPKAWVDGNTAYRAAQIVAGLDYLPFGDLVDGCFARAFYMNMELAVAGIPSSIQYAVADGGGLYPAPGIVWNFHAAPLLWQDGAVEPTILDPSMAMATSSGAGIAFSRSRWVELLRANQGIRLLWAEGSNLSYNDNVGVPGPFAPAELPTALAQVDAFPESDVSWACRLMDDSLRYEPGLSNAQRSAKREALSRRTEELLSELRASGMLAEDGSVFICN